MPRLSIFLTEHPSLDIDIVLDDRDTDLIAAGADVALLIGRLTDSAVTARKIGRCQRRVIATPAYFAARGVPQTPADLLAHQAIIYEQRDGGATWAFRRGTSETTVTVSGRLRVSATEGIRESVFAGLGFAIASEWAFAPELRSGVVQAVLTDWLLPTVDLSAVFPTGRQSSVKARAFASFIENQMSISGFGAVRQGTRSQLDPTGDYAARGRHHVAGYGSGAAAAEVTRAVPGHGQTLSYSREMSRFV
jgi:DNA-binding transcriptional LysR family regulator